MRSAASVSFITGVTIARAENQAITDTSKMVHPSSVSANFWTRFKAEKTSLSSCCKARAQP